jgi:hypothetical protein
MAPHEHDHQDAEHAEHGEDALACIGCGTSTAELDAAGLCVGCEDGVCDLIAEAFQDAPRPLTRAELGTDLSRRWPQLPDPHRVASWMLDRWVDSDIAEQISPGRYRLVPDEPAP